MATPAGRDRPASNGSEVIGCPKKGGESGKIAKQPMDVFEETREIVRRHKLIADNFGGRWPQNLNLRGLIRASFP